MAGAGIGVDDRVAPGEGGEVGVEAGDEAGLE